MGYSKFSKLNFLFLICIFYIVAGEKSTEIVNDQAALLSFKAGIIADPKHALETWNSSSGIHVCNWLGVQCNKRRDRVTELDLSHYSLQGTISPFLSNLSFLEILDLSQNSFTGFIPFEIGLTKLKELSLSSNHLQGKIPNQLGFLHQLVYLDLGSNRLSGEIPYPLLCNGSSKALQYLDLSNNSLSGKIPLKTDCELRELKFLLLWSNHFIGEIPLSLSNSSKLEWLDLESNFFGGELPSKIVQKMGQLQFLYLSYNNFTSHYGNTNLKPFFASLANNSSHLQELELAGNHLGGELPSIIGN
ncbi:hypothetical protein M9H77_06740 [Catharanthus roseus]|uniref:Uncharacterized protein n=1 Tax=Catharanthus roseus TaxID=4058 RepID=A0ACC0BSZ1_CATRO|nr:hypothetical protein M9H77_06740 [Catharanthus roseus]